MHLHPITVASKQYFYITFFTWKMLQVVLHNTKPQKTECLLSGGEGATKAYGRILIELFLLYLNSIPK